MKIVYCLNAICYRGGIERVTIAKANALAEIPDNEVWIIVTDNAFDTAIPLSSKVKLVDLKINYYRDQSPIPFIDIFREYRKRYAHKRILRKVLNEISPDIVVSVGQAEKYIIPSLNISSKPVLVRELHYYKYYRLDFADSWQKKVIARIADWYDFCWKINQYDAIVVLTHSDKEKYWKGNSRVRAIGNPLIEQPRHLSTCKNKTVMAVGRLVPQKNFESLLRAWRIVEDKHEDWRLKIWGEGVLKESLIELIERLALKNVDMMGFSSQIIDKYCEASLLAVTSRFEGFAMMILEAMSSGLPIVSYDCPCGPSDLIEDGVNGFLVASGDERTLAARICRVIDNCEERIEMGTNSVEKSMNYQIDSIISQWMNLFHELRTAKTKS